MSPYADILHAMTELDKAIVLVKKDIE